MCGPLVLAYSLNLNAPVKAKRRILPSGTLHHAAFHLGRITTYAFLGSVAALVVGMAGFAPQAKGYRSVTSLAAGLVMLIMGLEFLKIPGFRLFQTLASSSGLSSYPARLINSQSFMSKYVLGISVGFLPWMLPWAMLVKASSTQNIFEGFLTMALFGLGTVPALFFTGLVGSLISIRLRLLGERVAATSVIIMGIILIFKGLKHYP